MIDGAHGKLVAPRGGDGRTGCGAVQDGVHPLETKPIGSIAIYQIECELLALESACGTIADPGDYIALVRVDGGIGSIERPIGGELVAALHIAAGFFDVTELCHRSEHLAESLAVINGSTQYKRAGVPSGTQLHG